MKNDNLRVLGIESSCDETAAAIVQGGRVILSSVIASQVDLHAQFGGVYPELASREHVRAIHAVISETLQEAHMQISDLDAIAVTRGPGLAGSLVVGVNMAKALALSSELPIIGLIIWKGTCILPGYIRPTPNLDRNQNSPWLPCLSQAGTRNWS